MATKSSTPNKSAVQRDGVKRAFETFRRRFGRKTGGDVLLLDLAVPTEIRWDPDGDFAVEGDDIVTEFVLTDQKVFERALAAIRQVVRSLGGRELTRATA